MATLEIQIRFLDDRYHGNGDWPPDPFRLFQALVHGGHVGSASCSLTADHEAALDWLAALPPPEIDYQASLRGQAYVTFVPNNSLDRRRQSTKTSKPVAPLLLTRRAPEAPDLVYRWNAPDPSQAQAYLPALDQLAARLLALGWGIDIAAAKATVGDDPQRTGYETLVPTQRGGRAFRTLLPGLLAHLRERHEASRRRVAPEGVSPYTRPTRFKLTRYRQAGEGGQRRWCAFSLMRPDGESFALPWRQAYRLAAWLRHMAGEAMREEYGSDHKNWIDSYILGHTSQQEMGFRLSYIPVPSIGHPYSDGGVRRALIVEPPAVDERHGQALDLLRLKAPGRLLIGLPERRPEAVLISLGNTDRVLQRYLRTSSRSAGERGALSWRTVTPVILHGHNAGRKGISLRKTEKLLFQALDSAGYPVDDVESLSFQTAPYWPGCAAATAMKPPRHLDGRPRLHVAVDFRRPIEGPLVIGLGRHYGIGLFAAVED